MAATGAVRRAPGLGLLWVLVALAVWSAGCFVSDPGSHEPLLDDDGHRVGKGVRLVVVAEGLDDPVFVTHADDGSGRLFVVEQAGRVRVVLEGKVDARPFLDITAQVRSGGEQGLLGLAFHPAFPADPRVFVHYSDRDGDTVVSSFRLGGDGRLDPATEAFVLQLDQPYSNHNGGSILFGPDGYLYVALGDGGAGGDPQEHGQNTETLLGSILRLDVEPEEGYDVPSDNPFVGKAGRDEIWAYGLRNPWRVSIDRDNGDLWIGDVGQNSREEIDRLDADQAGANLGWNGLEGTHVFDRETHDAMGETVLPVAEYARSSPHCSVTGGYRYRGETVDDLKGVYVFADYCSGWVWGLTERSGDWVMGKLFESGVRASSFGEDEDGEVYLVDHGGRVLRFAPNGPV